jgi:hypothetical protein
MGVSGGPDVIQDGLVLALDAADRNSYPGSGTTWNDLSGNGNIGTVSGSANFSTTNGGSFSFPTSGSFIFPENSALNTQTPTVEVWARTNATNQNGFWFEKGNVNTQYSLFQESTTIVWRQFLTNLGSYSNLTVTTATYINTANWFQVVGTFTSGTRRIYVNGVLAGSDAQTGTIATNTNGSSIGVYGGFNGSRGYYYNGNIGTVKVYNRALSATEIAQNYNSLKSRFGLI